MENSDYPTFSDLALDKWFRQKVIESCKNSDIGSWWERKKGKEANEINIVALSVDGKTVLVAEAKHRQRNYDHRVFMEKVDCIKTCILSLYNIETPLLTLEDM